MSRGTSFSYWTVRYSLLLGAGLTASGNTAWISCADTPANLWSPVSILHSTLAVSLCL